MFASEGRGKGYVHVLKPPSVCVDVEKALAKTKVVAGIGGGDEMLVAKREKEVLLLPGMRLVPVRRRGHVLEWQLES